MTTEILTSTPGPRSYDGRDGDCDPSERLTYPGAAEQCDLQDNDCDTVVDDGVATDGDGDGDGWASCQGDCDDLDPARFPMNMGDATAAGRLDGVDGNCDDEDEFRAAGASITIAGSPGFSYLGATLAAGGVLSSADAWATVLADSPGDWLGQSCSDLGDLDGDGLPEIAVGGLGRSGIPAVVRIFDGARLALGGTFTTTDAVATISDSATCFTQIAALPDVTGDGVGDLAVATSVGSGDIDIYSGAALGRADVAWTLIGESLQSASVTSSQRALRAADLDGDGAGDLVFGSNSLQLGRAWMALGGAPPATGSATLATSVPAIWETDPSAPPPWAARSRSATSMETGSSISSSRAPP